MTDEDGFIQRWSRRKTAGKSREEPIADPIQEAAAVPAAAPDDTAETDAEPVVLEDLPDIESLEASSDFSVFMRTGVPEEMKKMALRRLWMLDPAFNEVDGLVEYGEDFTKISLAAVKSIYQVGKGFVNAEDEDELEDEEGESEGEDSAAEIPVSSEDPPEPDEPPEPEKT